MKKTVTANDSPKGVSATEEIDLGNNKKETRDTFASSLDAVVELIFDQYIRDNKDHVKELLRKWPTGQNELAIEFNTKIRTKAEPNFTLLKDILEANSIQQFKFELTDLKQDVIDMITTENKETGRNTSSDNVFIYPIDEDGKKWKDEKGEKKETKKYESYYFDPYKQTPSYANVDKERKIESKESIGKNFREWTMMRRNT